MSSLKDVKKCALCGDVTATLRERDGAFFCSACEGGEFVKRDARLTDIEHGGDGTGTGNYEAWEIPQGEAMPMQFNEMHVRAGQEFETADGCYEPKVTSSVNWLSSKDPIAKATNFTVSFIRGAKTGKTISQVLTYIGVTAQNRTGFTDDPGFGNIVTDLRNAFTLGYKLKGTGNGKWFSAPNSSDYFGSPDMVNDAVINYSRGYKADTDEHVYSLRVDGVVKHRMTLPASDPETWVYLVPSNNSHLCGVTITVDVEPFLPPPLAR